ncbi:MAG: SseB family protein [Actinomycetota bacterium]|nr:SseB family protein [Actinomycetota bacterium]
MVRGPEDAPGNVRLSHALASVADGHADAARQEVYRALLDGVVLVPTVEVSPGEGSTVAVFPDGEGGSVLVAFSNVGALRSWAAEAKTFVVVPGGELARVARRHRVRGVLLDPASPNRLSLAPAELDALADGLVPVRAGASEAAVGSPLPRRVQPTRFPFPEAALASLRGLSSRPEASAVHLLDVGYGGEDPVPTVVVELAHGVGDPGGLLEEIASSLASTLPRGQRVDVVEADDALLEATARLAAEGEETGQS